MKRHYNLKKGKPDVMGHVIEVDTENKLEDRVKILTSEDEQFHLLTYQAGEALYEANLDDGERTYNLGIKVLENGNTEIYNNPKDIKIYFTEIDAKKANELIEGYKSWIKMQMYMGVGSFSLPKGLIGGFVTHH